MRRLIQLGVLAVFVLALGGPGPTLAGSLPVAAPAQSRLVVFETFMRPG
jgi:hypothetical protein